MRDFAPILALSVLIAWGIVAMWRQVLTACIVVCLAIIFVGLFGVMSEAKDLLSHASRDQCRSHAASQGCQWAGRSPPSTNKNLGQART
jgi:hypothetical protein